MICTEERKKFFTEAVGKGWRELSEVPVNFLPEVPEHVKLKWLKILKTSRVPKYPVNPRLVNHFTLGADPEFVLYDPTSGSRMDGNRLGLRTGMAYGVDSNGRLLEIRPCPSRFALEVLASTLVTLRWFALTVPQALDFQWRSGAFVLRDGLGGHVHLGRKTANRKVEVEALDRVFHLLNGLGVFPQDECQARRAGDQFNQRYGLDGDIRLQKHGYEYRTLPSWLDSPWTAYLCLVLSKLVAHDPAIFHNLHKGTVSKGGQTRILNLFRKYAGLDDDAAIAASVLERHGLPSFQGGDFKTRWGLTYAKDALKDRNIQIPGNIKPSAEEMRELFCSLMNNTPLHATMPKAYWPTHLPSGYQTVLSYTDTTRVAGLGEVLAEMVVESKHAFQFTHSESITDYLRVSLDVVKSLPKNWRQLCAKASGLPEERFRAYDQGKNAIFIGRDARTSTHLRAVRRALLSEAFPIWKFDEVKSESYSWWVEKNTREKKEKPRKFASKVIYERGK